MKLFILFVFGASLLVGQTTHVVTLNWTDTLNPATGTTYSVYRATGLCSGTPVFAKIATAITAKTYDDTTVGPGNLCYVVTATVQGVDSPQSPTASAAVPSFAPTALTVTVK